MPIDASIYGTIGQPTSYLDYAAGYQRLRDTAAANALDRVRSQQAIDEYTRKADQASALDRFNREVIGQAPADQAPGLYRRAGMAPQATAAQAALDTSALHQSQAEHAAVQTQAGKRQYLMQGLEGMTDREAIKGHLADGVTGGVFSMVEAKRLMDEVPTDPIALAKWRDTHVIGRQAMGVETGRQDVAAETARRDAATAAAAEATRARQAAADAETARHHAALEARATSAHKSGSTQVVEGPNGFELVDKTTGVATPVTGSGGQVMGKRAQGVAQKAQDARDVELLLTDAEKLIPGATGSGIGAGVDTAAGWFGATTEGGEKIGGLRALEGSLLAKMPRMEGPQSDKDVALYRQAAGQLGDATVPTPIKKAAIAAIRGIQNRYVERPPAPVPTGPARVPLIPDQPRDLGNGFTVVR